MQNALAVTEIGKPVSLIKRAIPEPLEDEILIKVTSTMILPHDTLGRDIGLFIAEKLPYILGNNVSGVVQNLGANVSKYAVGDHIFGQSNLLHPTPDQSGLQQYAILEAASTGRVPEGFSDEDAATLPVNAVAVFLGLFHPTGFDMPPPFGASKNSFNYKAQTVVIIGGGSNAGKLATQFATLAGMGKIVVLASPSHEAELKRFGATHFFDRHSPNITAEVHGVTGPDVQYVLDCSNWTFELATSIVSESQQSCIATLHPLEGAAKDFITARRTHCTPKFIIGSSRALTVSLAGFWSHLPTWLKEGKIINPEYRIIEGLDAVRVNEALDSYRDGSRVVQALIRPNSVV